MMPPHSLYVLETLELDVSLISWEPDKIVEASELLAGCGPTPIRLYRDQESRYLIAHSAGVHAVCVGRTITSLRTIATMDIENEDESMLKDNYIFIKCVERNTKINYSTNNWYYIIINSKYRIQFSYKKNNLFNRLIIY